MAVCFVGFPTVQKVFFFTEYSDCVESPHLQKHKDLPCLAFCLHFFARLRTTWRQRAARV